MNGRASRFAAADRTDPSKTNLTRAELAALAEVAQHPEGYVRKPKTMERLRRKGFAAAGAHLRFPACAAFFLTSAGRDALAKTAEDKR
jgi:hypothetical protein